MGMIRRLVTGLAASSVLVALSIVPAMQAGATTSTRSLVVTSSVPATLSSSLPLVRLNFSGPFKLQDLPALSTKPAISIKWEQIGARSVQAVAVSKLTPAMRYTISLPTRMTCAGACFFSAVRPLVASVDSNLTWEAPLLAELDYLPVSFSASAPQLSPSDEVGGSFTWKYSALPTVLRQQWSVGTDNVILTGALMNFQSVHGLPTSGVADAATWTALVNAANANAVDPSTYDYVVVSMGSPETLTLYVANKVKFQTLVNTGISVAPTSVGTYPVYLRFTTQTMSGTNPDGSHYSDPGIPWVSYFHGGEALHGFIRSSYGWPQSLGCVEMPFASAQVVWPYTPIGTLVTT